MRRFAQALLVLALGLVAAQGQAQEEAAREPQGLRMQRKVDAVRVLLPWGVTSKEAQGLLPCEQGDPLCSQLHKGTSLFCGKEAANGAASFACRVTDYGSGGWSIDTGDVAILDRPTLYFQEGKFYSYTLDDISAHTSGALFEILRQALGEPSSSEESPRQNAYGATWVGSTRKWETQASEVVLSARMGSMDDGYFRVTYKPLRPPEKKAEGSAPF